MLTTRENTWTPPLPIRWGFCLRTFRQVQSDAAWERMGFPSRGVGFAESSELRGTCQVRSGKLEGLS